MRDDTSGLVAKGVIYMADEPTEEGQVTEEGAEETTEESTEEEGNTEDKE